MKIPRKIALHMEDRIFSGKDSLSITAFLQGFKTACDSCSIHDNATLWLFKHHLTGPIEAVRKARVALSKETAGSKERRLASFSAIFNYLLRLFETDGNTATAHADTKKIEGCELDGSRLRAATIDKDVEVQSGYDERIVKGLFMECVQHSIWQKVRQWLSQEQHVSLEHLAKECLVVYRPSRKETKKRRAGGRQ